MSIALSPHNAAVIALREWLENQRELTNRTLIRGDSYEVLLRAQGRGQFIAELLGTIDPERYPIGD